MSLPEAILEIAADMEEESKGLVSSSGAVSLCRFAKQLRRVVKASQTESTAQPPSRPVWERELLASKAFYDPEGVEARKIKQLLANTNRVAKEEESSGTRMVEIVGGPSDDGTQTLIPIPAEMPVGAKTCINGNVYTLTQEGKLVYSAEETQKYQEQIKSR